LPVVQRRQAAPLPSSVSRRIPPATLGRPRRYPSRIGSAPDGRHQSEDVGKAMVLHLPAAFGIGSADGGRGRMSAVGQREIRTQKRVIAFFNETLGYAYLGHWKDRDGNSNIEEERLTDWLRRQGHDDKLIGRALFELDKAAALGGSKTLYDSNREVYGLLRYGVKIRPEVGEQTVTVWLVDWQHPESNDFAVAEEVTVFGVHAKRP